MNRGMRLKYGYLLAAALGLAACSQDIVRPDSGRIVFQGRDITGLGVTDVCQLGLTKSYQVNQLFNRLTVRENVTIAALAKLRG